MLAKDEDIRLDFASLFLGSFVGVIAQAANNVASGLLESQVVLVEFHSEREFFGLPIARERVSYDLDAVVGSRQSEVVVVVGGFGFTLTPNLETESRLLFLQFFCVVSRHEVDEHFALDAVKVPANGRDQQGFVSFRPVLLECK
jgi:hypothetical protein